jgi:hypothetical protein
MWWLAIFLMQDARAQQPEKIRAAMDASIAKQRASIEQQIKFIKSPVPPAIPPSFAVSNFSVPPPVAYA